MRDNSVTTNFVLNFVVTHLNYCLSVCLRCCDNVTTKNDFFSGERKSRFKCNLLLVPAKSWRSA